MPVPFELPPPPPPALPAPEPEVDPTFRVLLENGRLPPAPKV